MVTNKEFHKKLIRELINYEESYNIINTLLTIIVSFAVGYIFYIVSIWENIKSNLDLIMISLLIFLVVEILLFGFFVWFRGKRKEAINNIDNLN